MLDDGLEERQGDAGREVGHEAKLVRVLYPPVSQ